MNCAEFKMSLDTNAQHDENPFNSQDMLGRNLLWDFMNNGKNPKEISKNDSLYFALQQFSWFYPIQQECMYRNLPIKELRELTKYLKDNVNKC